MTQSHDWQELFNLSDSFFEDFELLAVVGKGGMGQVVKARQIALDRLVAIKFLARKFFEDETTMARFESEAKMLAKLNHPNVVQIITLNSKAKNPYLVLEYVDGLSLRKKLKDVGSFSQSEALHIIGEVCRGLKAAHELNIIHRDVKSDNVLISKNGDIKLVDFGIAKETEGRGDQTTTGVVMGTPHYMSPEQCHGETLDCRTDIYSTGVLLFRLLTGRVPFYDQSTIKVLFHHVNTPPPDLGEFKENVKEEVNELVQKAMAKEREDRFQSAQEFFEAIEDVKRELKLTGAKETRKLKKSSHKSVPSTWWQENPLVAGILLLIFLMLVVTWFTIPEAFYERPKVKVDDSKKIIHRIEEARKRLIGWRDIELFEGKALVSEIAASLQGQKLEVRKKAEESLGDVIRSQSPGGTPLEVAIEAAMQLAIMGHEGACESLLQWLPSMKPSRRLDVLLVLRRRSNYVLHRFSKEAKEAIGKKVRSYLEKPPIEGATPEEEKRLRFAISEYHEMLKERPK